MEFEIQFSDRTLLEANGEFAKVCKIMKKEAIERGSIGSREEWVIRSKISILNPFGFTMFICSFYNTGKVYISEYMPSSKDIHNTDIRSLTYWCNEFGWKTPEPMPSIVESWPDFWKKEWETFIVDSSFLDKKFGTRKEMQFEDKTDSQNEDNDDNE